MVGVRWSRIVRGAWWSRKRSQGVDESGRSGDCGGDVGAVAGGRWVRRRSMTLPAYASGDAGVPQPGPGGTGPSVPPARSSYTRFVVWWVVVCTTLLLVSATMRIPLKTLSRRALCQDKESQIGVVFRMYSGEHEGWLPLSLETGVLQPDWAALGDKYLLNRTVLVCLSDDYVDEKAVVDGRSAGSYYYLGYVVRDEKEWEAFAAAYRARIAGGGGFEEDLPIPGDYGGGVVRRLSRAAISELAQEPDGADIPVLFERPDNHVHDGIGGMNVLYADGHVQFVKFGTKFPAIRATVDFIDALEGLDG